MPVEGLILLMFHLAGMALVMTLVPRILIHLQIAKPVMLVILILIHVTIYVPARLMLMGILLLYLIAKSVMRLSLILMALVTINAIKALLAAH